MVKTQDNSRFVLLSLSNIRESKDVVLQAEDTETKFTDGNKCYLCEVVNNANYKSFEPWAIRNELIKVNEERRALQNKCNRQARQIERFEKQVDQLEAQAKADFAQIQKLFAERKGEDEHNHCTEP